MYKKAVSAIRLGLLLPLLFWSLRGVSQDSAYKHPLPFMWYGDSYQYGKNFRDFKRPRLDNPNSQSTALFLGNFLGMIDYFNTDPSFSYLRMFIAALPSKSQLTLIFSPVAALNDTPRRFYIIPPDKPFDPSPDAIKQFKVDPDTAAKWEKRYVDMMPNLRRTIDNSLENRMGDGTYSDTRCITYRREALQGLLDEKGFIHTDPSNRRKIEFTNDMLASFAAFDKNGNPRTKKGSKRLFVQLDFLDPLGVPVNLEEDTYLGPTGKRAESDSLKALKLNSNSFRSLDNGTLCPPCTNCPPGTPGCAVKKLGSKSNK